MKKIFLIPTLILTLFFTINKVSADTSIESHFYDKFDLLNAYYTTYGSNIDMAVNYWQSHYSSDYPYYYVILGASNFIYDEDCTIDNLSACNIRLYYSNSPLFTLQGVNNSGSLYYIPYKCNDGTLNGSCDLNRHYLHIKVTSSGSLTSYDINTPFNSINSDNPTFFNGSPGSYNLLGLTSNNIVYDPSLSYYYSNFTSLEIPSYIFGSYNFSSYTISENSFIPSYVSLTNNTYDPTPTYYSEINLNNYNSVILSLKDYTSRNSFNTIIPTLGQLCLTPVYDYGMKNKGDYYPGYEVQGCTPQYNDFTPVSISILSSDINNHAVYYIKPYNTSIENKIKVNTTIFDITYVTSENANNPTVIVGGRSYPVIPYSDLSSSATTSTENGYIPGASCQLGDLNCQASVSGMDISDLFTHPLELLKNMWSAITSVFSVITAFILLLPTPLQTFLYVAFMFAVILGILKLILGG